MLSRGKRVLVVGHELESLRQYIPPLASAGAQVVISEPTELQTHVGRERFDLVVLGHALPPTVRKDVIQNAHTRWPGIQVAELVPTPHATSELVMLED